MEEIYQKVATAIELYMLLQNRTRAEIKERKKRQLLLIPPKKLYIYMLNLQQQRPEVNKNLNKIKRYRHRLDKLIVIHV
jgi:hypothetical protein